MWFSQGATIGCGRPDGGPSNPNARDRCGSGTKATINDPALRTVNVRAAAGSAADVTKHNPWRKPGSAPVYHPCGMAGGGPAYVDRGRGGEAEYTNTSIAQQGDLGSVLPRAPTGTVWKRGGTIETGWSIRANHGGG
jgi:hypothetical protein